MTKLSQYAGAYTVATIDKASKVSQLMKEKDQKIALLEEKATADQQRITQLEQQLIEESQNTEQLIEKLNIEKQKLDQQAIHKEKQLPQELNKLQVMLQQEKIAKEEQSALFFSTEKNQQLFIIK